MSAATNKQGKQTQDAHRVNLRRSAFFAPRSSPKTRPPLLQPEKDELARMMAAFELLSEMSLDQIAEIAAVSTLRVYHVGEFIWKRGDQVSEIALLESGFVKLARRDQTGASKTYGLYGPGDTIGLFAMFAGMKHSVDAVALNEGLRTICIDAQEFLKFAAASATLSANLRDQMTRFSETLINTIEVIKAGAISQRLAVLLMQLVERYGVDRTKDQARLPFSLTLEQMSEIVDARIETVARALGHWKRAGWLSTTPRGFIFPQLAAIVELLPK